MNAIDWVNQKNFQQKNGPDFKAGDTVKVFVKIREGDKERIQIFEGVVIAIHRNGAGTTFTVRKVSYGVGVERIFPFFSPAISKIELVSEGLVRRAKLYYLRGFSGKKARIKAKEQFKILVKEEAQQERLETVPVLSEKSMPVESKREQPPLAQKKERSKKSTQKSHS